MINDKKHDSHFFELLFGCVEKWKLESQTKLATWPAVRKSENLLTAPCKRP